MACLPAVSWRVGSIQLSDACALRDRCPDCADLLRDDVSQINLYALGADLNCNMPEAVRGKLAGAD